MAPPLDRWQLTVDALDPARQAAFWRRALGWEPQPPPAGFASWPAWYASYGEDVADLPDDFYDRIQDPAGTGPRIWFQIADELPQLPPDRHRLHLDLFVEPREVPPAQRRGAIDRLVADLVALGAEVEQRWDELPQRYHVRMHDPEGNVFCVA